MDLRGHLSTQGLSLSKLILDRSRDVQHPSPRSVIAQMAFDDGVAVTRLLGQCQPRQHAVLQYDMLARVFGCLRPLAAAFMCLILESAHKFVFPEKCKAERNYSQLKQTEAIGSKYRIPTFYVQLWSGSNC